MAETRTAGFGRRAGASAPTWRAATTAPSPMPAPVAKAPPGILSRLPWFTVTLAGTLILQFHSELRSATDFNAPLAPGHFTLLALGGSDSAQVLGHHEWWRLFTATVLHGSVEHLVGNLIALLVAGALLEPMIGIGWFATIYLTGAFAGALLSTWLNPADVLSVGASGAIMACLSALFTLSFRDGAWRPGLLRRVAGFLLFPALLPSVSSGAVTDINAHLGGMLAGIGLAFVLLLTWHDEAAEPPLRSPAALAAGLWLALTAGSFWMSWGSYAQYARDGLDYIPPAAMPRSVDDMKAQSFALVDKYPKDPRAHLFRGLYLLSDHDLSDAEPHLRQALSLGEKSGIMAPAFRDWTAALLALDLKAQGRGEEARTLATPLCSVSDERTRAALDAGQLC